MHTHNSHSLFSRAALNTCTAFAFLLEGSALGFRRATVGEGGCGAARAWAASGEARKARAPRARVPSPLPAC